MGWNLFASRNEIAQTRNVLTSIIWTVPIVGTVFGVSILANSEMQLPLFYLFCLNIGGIFLAWLLFAIVRPEMLLSESTQVQNKAIQTFGQSSLSGRETIDLIGAIRTDPLLLQPTRNNRSTPNPNRDRDDP